MDLLITPHSPAGAPFSGARPGEILAEMGAQSEWKELISAPRWRPNVWPVILESGS